MDDLNDLKYPELLIKEEACESDLTSNTLHEDLPVCESSSSLSFEDKLKMYADLGRDDKLKKYAAWGRNRNTDKSNSISFNNFLRWAHDKHHIADSKLDELKKLILDHGEKKLLEIIFCWVEYLDTALSMRCELYTSGSILTYVNGLSRVLAAGVWSHHLFDENNPFIQQFYRAVHEIIYRRDYNNPPKPKQGEAIPDADWHKLKAVAEKITNPGENLNYRLFLTIGVMMRLRGGSFRDLNFSKFRVAQKDGIPFIFYDEGRTKNDQPYAFQDPDNIRFSAPELLDELKTARPAGAIDALFLLPLRFPRGTTLFANAPIGKNTLSEFLTKLCKLAGIPERPIRAFRQMSIQAMHRFALPVDQIKHITGHRTLEGVQSSTQNNSEMIQAEQERLKRQRVSQTSVSSSSASPIVPFPLEILAPGANFHIPSFSGNVYIFQNGNYTTLPAAAPIVPTAVPLPNGHDDGTGNSNG